MPPVLLVTAVWKRAMVIPCLVDVAKGPWQPEQLAVYSAAPSMTVGGVAGTPDAGAPVGVGLSAASMACKSGPVSAVRLGRLPMPPTLPLIAFWIRTNEAPSLADVAKGPWQVAQLALYKVAPVDGTLGTPEPGKGTTDVAGAALGLLIARSIA